MAYKPPKRAKKYQTANLTEDAAARKWADYMRLRRRPVKECWGCRQAFPNTLEHFTQGVRGRVGVRCHACVQANPVPTRAKAPCPCCGILTALVLDRHAPSAVFVCRTCLRTINHLLDLDANGRRHINLYIMWRAGQENAAPALPGEGAARYSECTSASSEAPAETAG